MKTEQAVADGIRQTAVTSAAIVMVAVLAIFARCGRSTRSRWA